MSLGHTFPNGLPVMKPFPLLVAVVALTGALPSASAGPQSGGRFRLDATAVAAGGNVVQGGRFRVEATIGQPATESLGTQRFHLAGGFWTPITVRQTPDAPELKIELLSDGLVRLGWAATASGYVLQGSVDPAGTDWVTVPTRPIEAPDGYRYTVPASDALRCYRLWK